MAKQIDWLYHRAGCNTCKKAQAYFNEHGVAVKETVQATKSPQGPNQALELAAAATRLIATKGNKVLEVPLTGKNAASKDEILALMIGPTGKLRAPTYRKGKTLVVGFDANAYQQALGT